MCNKNSGARREVFQHWEIELYGHKENDLIRFPDATNVRKYPDTVMVSNGPQRGYTASTSSDFDSWHVQFTLYLGRQANDRRRCVDV